MKNNLIRGLSGRQILVVEDERLIALDIRNLLETCGCTVMGPVASTAAALALIGDQLPDAAILDVNLGSETSEPIAAVLRANGCPFLVLTAYSKSHLTGALTDAPLLSKPFDERDLRRELAGLFAT